MKNTKFKIGDFVEIINYKYYAYYGYADSLLRVKDIKICNSDNLHLNNFLVYKLETLNGKSIEGENYNEIWIPENEMDFKKSIN